jgi:hydroxymethylglutaryl-CoA lyase
MQTKGSDFVTIMEVGARDGLQNEPTILSVETKLALIESLCEAGIQRIEAGSFVSPKWVPQMANSDALLAQLTRKQNVEYSALTPNLHGLEKAIAARVNRVSVFSAASESFTQKNINCSIDESIARFSDVIHEARKHSLPVRGYISCIAGCPYEGKIEISAVVSVAQKLIDQGCDELSLGDTIGVGNPKQIKDIIQALQSIIDIKDLAVHFHDTYGQALANTLAAIECGIRTVDTSIAGLGGCPYAKGASGNLATEDVVFMLNGLGLNQDVDLHRLAIIGEQISKTLGIPYRSKAGFALTAK